MEGNTYNIRTRAVSGCDDGERLSEYLNDQHHALQAVLNGDIVLVLTPATTGSSAAGVAEAIEGDAGKFTREVVVTLEDSAGNIIKCGATFAIAVAEVTAGDGVSAIADEATNIVLEEGQGVVTLEYTGTWAAGDTCTLTVTGGTVAGVTVSNKTSVDTLVE